MKRLLGLLGQAPAAASVFATAVLDVDPDALGLANAATVTGFPAAGSGAYAVTVADAPTYRTAIANTHAAIRFDGVNDALQVAGFDPGSGPLTVYLVTANASGGSDSVLVELGANATAATDAFYLQRIAAHGWPEAYVKGNAGVQSMQTTQAVGAGTALVTAVYRKDAAHYEARAWVNDQRNPNAANVGTNNTVTTFGTATLNVGARNGGASLPTAFDLVRLLVYRAAHTAAQRLAVSAALRTRYGLGALTNHLWFEGDSITYGSGATAGQSYPAQLVAASSGVIAYDDSGVIGAQVSGGVTDEPYGVNTGRSGLFAGETIVVWYGSNDLKQGSTATAFLAALASYVTTLRADGWDKIVVNTVLARGDTPPAGFETERQTLNAALRANTGTYGDIVADVAGDARIGGAAAYADTTYFNADTIHPNATGYAVIYPYVKVAIAALSAGTVVKANGDTVVDSLGRTVRGG